MSMMEVSWPESRDRRRRAPLRSVMSRSPSGRKANAHGTSSPLTNSLELKRMQLGLLDFTGSRSAPRQRAGRWRKSRIGRPGCFPHHDYQRTNVGCIQHIAESWHAALSGALTNHMRKALVIAALPGCTAELWTLAALELFAVTAGAVRGVCFECGVGRVVLSRQRAREGAQQDCKGELMGATNPYVHQRHLFAFCPGCF